MHLLVTGGAGFIGSNFIRGVLAAHPQTTLVNLDALTYAGNLSSLTDVAADPRYRFVKGDIREAALASLFAREHFDAVVNFAAESHVDRSIEAPQVFATTNVAGTANLLQLAHQSGVRTFLQVSTDEVYGSPTTGEYDEQAALTPSSPYAASKASADLFALAFHHTYGMDVRISRCTNNFGPYQYPEKLIPLMIQRLLDGQPLPVYGSGTQTRDWIAVADHCRALDVILHRGQPGQIYNVSAHHECTNLALIQRVAALLKRQPNIVHVADRLGHDARYGLATGRIAALGWQPQEAFDTALAQTVQWYVAHEPWWRPLV